MLRERELSILRSFSIIQESQNLELRRGWKMLKMLISLSLSTFDLWREVTPVPECWRALA
jgi:hypothetical protein